MGLTDRIKAALKAFAYPGMGWGGGGDLYGGYGEPGYGLRWLPGSDIDWVREAGLVHKNSAVAAYLGWIQRNIVQATPTVYRMDADGEEQTKPDHPLLDLLERPNAHQTGRHLRQALALSYNVSGNAYAQIVRNKLRGPLELWYIPHFLVRPRWQADGSTWIDYYEVFAQGRWVRVELEDMVHIKFSVDPENNRMGLSPLMAAMREVVSDNEGSTYSAGILMNGGAPGVILSPDGDVQILKDDRERLKEDWERRFTRGRQGQAFVSGSALKVQFPGFTPEQMALDSLRTFPETRIGAAIGIDPMVVGLKSGLEHSTYSNKAEALRGAWENNILPTLQSMGDALGQALLPEYEQDADGWHIGWDVSRVKALQENDADRSKRLGVAVGGPWMSPNEARAECGMPAHENEDADDIRRLGTPEPAPGQPGAKPPADDKSHDKTAARRALLERFLSQRDAA